MLWRCHPTSVEVAVCLSRDQVEHTLTVRPDAFRYRAVRPATPGLAVASSGWPATARPSCAAHGSGSSSRIWPPPCLAIDCCRVVGERFWWQIFARNCLGHPGILGPMGDTRAAVSGFLKEFRGEIKPLSDDADIFRDLGIDGDDAFEFIERFAARFEIEI